MYAKMLLVYVFLLILGGELSLARIFKTQELMFNYLFIKYRSISYCSNKFTYDTNYLF